MDKIELIGTAQPKRVARHAFLAIGYDSGKKAGDFPTDEMLLG